MDLLNSLTNDITSIESALAAVDIMADSNIMDNVTNLKMIYSTSFRQHIFHFHNKPHVKNSILIEKAGKPVTYSDLCRFLRTYIINNNLLEENGLIKCDTFLQKVCRKDTVSLFELLKHVKQIIC